MSLTVKKHFNRMRWRLVSAQVVGYCVYKIPKNRDSSLGTNNNAICLTIWDDISQHLILLKSFRFGRIAFMETFQGCLTTYSDVHSLPLLHQMMRAWLCLTTNKKAVHSHNSQNLFHLKGWPSFRTVKNLSLTQLLTLKASMNKNTLKQKNLL